MKQTAMEKEKVTATKRLPYKVKTLISGNLAARKLKSLNTKCRA